MSVVCARISADPTTSIHSAIGLQLGVNLGLTSLVLFGATGSGHWYPVMLILGVLLFQWTHRDWSRGIGQLLFSLGLVLLGVALSRQALVAVGSGFWLIGIGAGIPVLAWAILGLGMTVACQSSSVTILAMAGMLQSADDCGSRLVALVGRSRSRDISQWIPDRSFESALTNSRPFGRPDQVDRCRADSRCGNFD